MLLLALTITTPTSHTPHYSKRYYLQISIFFYLQLHTFCFFCMGHLPPLTSICLSFKICLVVTPFLRWVWCPVPAFPECHNTPKPQCEPVVTYVYCDSSTRLLVPNSMPESKHAIFWDRLFVRLLFAAPYIFPVDTMNSTDDAYWVVLESPKYLKIWYCYGIFSSETFWTSVTYY